MARLLCTGDIHLGHGAALGRAPGDRLKDQADVLGRIGGLAVEHQVDLILNTGDTFEGPGIPPEQLQLFARFVDACRLAGVPVVALTGNGKHDAAVRETNGVAIFEHIPGIRVSSRPELIDIGDVTIATLPWVHPGRLIAARNGDQDRETVNRDVAELLVATARGLRAQIPEGRTAILALHWSISGASLPTGIPTDQLAEPVLDLFNLADLGGFDAIVASHIHVPQFAPPDDDGTPLGWLQPKEDGDAVRGPVAFYTGSPMPLNFGETSVSHGVWILDTDFEGGTRAEFVPIPSRPLVTIDVDVAATVEGDVGLAHNAIVDAIEARDLSGAIVRLRYRATADQARRLDPNAIRAQLLDAGAHSVKLAPEIVRPDRARVDTVTEDVQPLDAYDAWTGANDVDPDVAARARAQLAEDLETVTT